MHPSDAMERQRSLRAGQSARARIVEGELIDMEAITATAIADGVPPRFAGLTKALWPRDSHWYTVVSNAVDAMMTPNEGHDGLLLYSRSISTAGQVAGGIYTGAVVRNRAAKWINFAEYCTMLGEKITVDSNREWDVGGLNTWLTELESIRFCYDLVVVHDLRVQLMSPFNSGELYKLVAARAVRGLFTVLTAPFGQQELWTNASALKGLTEEQTWARVAEKGVSLAGK